MIQYVGNLYVIVRTQRMKREMFCVTSHHSNYSMKIRGGGPQNGKASVFSFLSLKKR